MSSIFYIIIGLLVMFLVFFMVAWGLTALYFWISKEEMNWLRDIKISSTLAVTGVVASLLLMIVASSFSIYVFGFVSTLICGLCYGALLKYFWKFSYFDAGIISFSLAIILNLGWLRLLGIL